MSLDLVSTLLFDDQYHHCHLMEVAVRIIDIEKYPIFMVILIYALFTQLESIMCYGTTIGILEKLTPKTTLIALISYLNYNIIKLKL